jgi:hypothetical protein
MAGKLNRKELRQMVQNMKPGEVVSTLTEALESKEIRPDEFSIRELFEETVPDGKEAVETFNPSAGGCVQIMEAVDSSLFKAISGQIIYTAMLEAYQSPQFIGDKLARNISTKFDGERIAGITAIGDVAESVNEGREYPRAGVSGTFVETPQTTKRGMIVEVTKEAVFFDKTGQVLDNANKVGEWLGVNKEKRIIDAALGVTSLWNPEGKGALSTYSNSTGLHSFDNLSNAGALADWTDIDGALQLFDAITDPFTGEPIIIEANQLLIAKAYAPVARYVLNATQIKSDPNANAGTAQYVQYFPPSTVIPGTFEILTNQWVTARMTAGSVNTQTWYLGQFHKAFAYMENWPLTVVQDAGGERTFTADIVARYKASERGTVAALDPRYAVLTAPS